MEQVYQDGPLPTALFIANDPTALGALDFLREKNVEIPQQVSIISFDGHELHQPAFNQRTNPNRIYGKDSYTNRNRKN